MPAFNEDPDRQVVPRWRSFTAALDFGELRPLRVRSPAAFTEKMLQDILEDWSREPSLSVAADVVSAAFSIGCTGAAREAADFVLAHKNATPSARDIAKRCVGACENAPSAMFTQYYGTPDYLLLKEAIHSARSRLSDFPTNPVLWTNLALLFATLGLDQKAKRAMLTALGLAPNNRFVVRAASRLFLHQGDYERAHVVLVKSDGIKTDPWLLAGEVAIAAIRQRTSLFVKNARRLVDSQNYSPFHLSELFGALATIEAHDGGLRKAKKLCRLSLADPAENAIAQAAWLSRRIGDPTWEPPSSVTKSSEANAWKAGSEGRWTVAFNEAKRWLVDQPFSSRPAILAGYVASVALNEHETGAEIFRRALLSNHEDATLHNNLGFSLAMQDKAEEAQRVLEHAWHLDLNGRQRACLTATEGLIAFRSGQHERGRQLYRQAIHNARSDPSRELSNIAAVYHVLEELRIGSPHAMALTKQGLAAASNLAEPLRSLFVEKLHAVARSTRE